MAELSVTDPRRRADVTILGIIVVAGILLVGLWAAALASIAAARNTAMAHARIEAHNLAAGFADEVTHTLDGIAAGMDIVARRMRNEPGPYDINDWARKISILSFGTIQGAIIGPDGRLISTTLDPRRSRWISAIGSIFGSISMADTLASSSARRWSGASRTRRRSRSLSGSIYPTASFSASSCSRSPRNR